jgi:hypothetical protein
MLRSAHKTGLTAPHRAKLTVHDVAFKKCGVSGVHSGVSRRGQPAELTEVLGGTGGVRGTREREHLTSRLGRGDGELALGLRGVGPLSATGARFRCGRSRRFGWVGIGCRLGRLPPLLATRRPRLKTARLSRQLLVALPNRRKGRFRSGCGLALRDRAEQYRLTATKDRGENNRHRKSQVKEDTHHVCCRDDDCHSS